MQDDGWREAMCGTIAFFDSNGDRMHTIYTAASPEYGKGTFLTKFSGEIEKVVKRYPNVPLIGLADEAASNWSFIERESILSTLILASTSLSLKKY